MNDENPILTLFGRVFINCQIQTQSGLAIGGSGTMLGIGGIDKEVIVDQLTGKPYIPGSSLKGKIRSQMEKFFGLPQNQQIAQSRIHSCQDKKSYHNCATCKIFGLPGEHDFTTPTRLVVRDIPLNDKSAKELRLAKTDLRYTEAKTEVAIDRITAQASPRTIERVPAGAMFGPAEMVYSIYEQADVERFENVVEGMQLLEDDYLGGSGSRGSGKVAFCKIQVYARARGDYRQRRYYQGDDFEFADLAALNDELKDVVQWIKNTGVPVQNGREG